jgi:hypothetical protein
VHHPRGMPERGCGQPGGRRRDARYGDGVPPGPHPDRARALLSGLDGLRATVADAEDDVLACLVVTGEPAAQRVVDDWLDQVADTLRALGEVADDLAPTIAGYAGPRRADPSGGDPSDDTALPRIRLVDP